MSRISWHRSGENEYRTGLDRGVLYPLGSAGVPWNGLLAVEEDNSSISVETFSYDGIRFNMSRSPGDFSGSLRAYTYPEEFEPYDGLGETKNGMLLTNQPVYDLFGLAYRVKIGSDLDTAALGYEIHLVYNLMATPDNRSRATVTDQPRLDEFSWKLEGIPEPVVGYRPTAHVIVDTTKVNRFLVAQLEDILYGKGVAAEDETIIDGGTVSDSTSDILDGGTASSSSGIIVDGNDFAEIQARLPSLQELVDLFESWSPIFITDNGDGTWTADGPDELFTWINSTTVDITGAVIVDVDADTYDISSS